jgi:hypothetical protein
LIGMLKPSSADSVLTIRRTVDFGMRTTCSCR